MLQTDTASEMWAGPVTLPESTLAMLFLLGPMVVIWFLAETATQFQKRLVDGKEVLGEKILTLLRCSSILAGVLALCYVCEHHFPNEHMKKTERPWMYWGTFIVLIVVSIFTLRKTENSDFMNRDQTEEWKGWMQFLFLQYHYWKMEDAYKDIRVYITCYLWMTGFGNFSFFYMKSDFSLLRVLQMVWRMNFFVFFLCMTMNNPYIVYYICPLHTFYFLVTYTTMVLYQKANHDRFGGAMKCLLCAGFLWLIYDLIPKAFHVFFAWLGTTPTGASIGSHGVEWEWYFRSYLDHFSTVWGMVFALNMPFLAAWFKKVESLSAAREWGIKLSVLAVMVALFAVWAHYVYSRDKGSYNAIHSYYSVIPLLTYLFIRNISKTMRQYYLHGLHWFGTITLESYLLQYHIWLADNAGKLLNIVPGSWFLTFIIASCVHVFCAVQIFNVTTKLRSVVLPNDLGASLRNLFLLMMSVLVSFVVAMAFKRASLGAPHLVWVIAIISLGAAGVAKILFAVQSRASGIAAKATAAQSNVGVQVTTFVAMLACLVVVHRLLAASRHAPGLVHLSAETVELGVPVSELLSHEPRSEYLMNFDRFELWDSFAFGRTMGFKIGSLAQSWHGLVAMVGITLCIVSGDAYFGLARLTLAIGGCEGAKTIGFEEAYGGLLKKIGVRKGDVEEAPTERTPLVAQAAAAAESPAAAAGSKSD